MTLNVLTSAGPVARSLRIVTSAPNAFLALPVPNPYYPEVSCAGIGGGYPEYLPVARNADGLLNSCDQPAPAGSEVTLFLNGISPGAHTVTLENPGPVVVAGFDPDMFGLWKLRVRVSTSDVFAVIQPLIDGTPLRESGLALFFRN